jgi:hypothetical protein
VSSLIGLAVLLVVFPLSAAAQDTGSISGTVTDKSGAAIIAAEVTLTNVGKTLTRNTVTNDVGAYVIAGLPGDTYNLSVIAKGFQKFTASKLVLNVADKARVDVTMTIGSVTEEIVVTGENVAQVDTASAEIGGTITGKQVNELELNGRNFTQLVTLTPGVVSQTGQDEGTVGVYGNVSYSMNGGRTEYNNWELDGGDNMDNGSNATLNVYPNLEAIAEFKVLTSNYGAQYGRNASGTVEVETKSGTSTFHGSAFYYGRNEIFNARSWEEGADTTAKKAPYRKHDWGYTFGGPVFIPNHYNTDKKKTFFFWSQEWRRESNPTSFNQEVPSDAERGGNFSDLCPTAGTPFLRSSTDPTATVYPDCPAVGQNSNGTFNTFPNNTITSIDPNAQYLLNVLPTANNFTANPFPSFVQTVSLPTTWREELIRVDHNLTENHRLTFRYIHDSWQTTTATPLWGNGTSFPNVNTSFAGPGTSFVARLTSNFTPTLLNEFVASYTADHIFLEAVGPVSLPSGFNMPPLFDNGFVGKLPSFVINNGNAYGGGFSWDSGYFPWKNANPTYTYRDNLTKTLGNHTMLIGIYFAAAQKNQENSLYTQGILTFDNGSTYSTGNAFADLLAGNISSYSQSNQQIIFYDRYKITEPYFQDDWRVTRKLTLNLGLRWSFFGRYQERYNQEYGFSPALYSASNAPFIDVNGTLPGNASGSAGVLSGSSTSLTAPSTSQVFNGYIQCGVAPAPTGCQQNKYMNPAPRFGFAFDPFGNGKMAIRGGYGIFFEHTNGNEANAESLQQGASPLVLISQQNNIPGYANVGGGLTYPINPWSIAERATWPYVQQWNLGVQKELPGNVLMSAAYVGSKGTHLTQQRDLNQLHRIDPTTNPFAPGQAFDQSGGDCNFTTNAQGLPVSATLGNSTAVPSADVPNMWVACQNDANPFRPYYGYGTINRLELDADSIYHALQIAAQRTIGSLTFSAAYTYSHSIDDSSDRYDTAFLDSYDLRAARASSNFDQRHAFSISYVYALPFFKSASSPALRAALGGWQVSGITVAQSGTPFNVANGNTYTDSAGLGNGLGTASRPDLVGDPFKVGNSNTAARGPLYLNPGAFSLPQGLTYGTLGRNYFTYPGRLNFDFGLFKHFQINERMGFEFRWETFNVFNHTQFNAIGTSMDTVDPGGSAGSSGFLHLNGAHAPRRMQFGLRFQF